MKRKLAELEALYLNLLIDFGFHFSQIVKIFSGYQKIKYRSDLLHSEQKIRRHG